MELTLEKLKDGEKGVVERLTLTGPTKRRRKHGAEARPDETGPANDDS